MFIQKKETVFDLIWQASNSHTTTYGDIFLASEKSQSYYNLDHTSTDRLWQLFELYEAECQSILATGAIEPAYDYCLKCSHCFNLLDVTARMTIILRIRKLANACAKQYMEQLA